ALGHSLSAEPGDGIFIPPVPTELMQAVAKT
ncbi:hypothetical protein AK812_SmicGene47277, partial [Symbiodinium microadriaticum]